MPYSAGVFFLAMKLKPPKIIRHLFPSLIWEIDDPEGVFLTFDDGPTPGITEWILAMLEKYDAKATFFVLGKNVEAYPDLFRRIVDAGHKVGNHTYSHQKGWGMSLERYIEDVDFANDLIHSELFRPPYARITPAQARALSQRYKLVMWHIISRDYNRRLSPRTCLKNVCFPMELAGVKKAEAEKDQAGFEKWCELMLDQAALADQGTVKDPARFVKLMNELLLK